MMIFASKFDLSIPPSDSVLTQIFANGVPHLEQHFFLCESCGCIHALKKG